jgi:hypothetical protein
MDRKPLGLTVMNESYQSEFTGKPQHEVLGMPFANNHQAMWISDRGTTYSLMSMTPHCGSMAIPERSS